MSFKQITTTVVLSLLAVSGVAFAEDQVALDGYCPVAYVEAGKAVKGSPKHAVKQDGVTYLFASEGAKKLFVENPKKYLVKYDGFCAYAVANGYKAPGKGEFFSVYQGAVYLFFDAATKKAFDADPAKMAAKADAEWKKLAPAKK